MYCNMGGIRMKRFLLFTGLSFLMIAHFTVLAMEEEWELIESPKEKIVILIKKKDDLNVVDFNIFLKSVSKYLDVIDAFVSFIPDVDRLKSVRVVDSYITIVKQSMAVHNDIDVKLRTLYVWVTAKSAQALFESIKKEVENNFGVLRNKGIRFNELSAYPFFALTSEQAEKKSYQEIRNLIEAKKRTAKGEANKLILRQIEYQLGNQFKKKEFDAYLKGIEGITTLFNEYQKDSVQIIKKIDVQEKKVIELREKLGELEYKLNERKKPLEIDEYLQETEVYADNAAERIKKMNQKSELEAERAVIGEKINQLGVYEKRKLTPLQKNTLWGLKNQGLPTLSQLIKNKLIRIGVKR